MMDENKWNDQVEKAWNQNAADWHARSADMWEHGSRKTIVPFFTRHVPLAEGDCVLDAGCGDGYASWKLAQLGYRVEGVDLSAEMIRLASQRTAETGTLHFRQSDVAALPYQNDCFAGILSINVVEFTPSPLKTLREFHRVLRSGGVLVIGILGPTAGPRAFSYRRLYDEHAIQNTLMPWEARQLAEENGFGLIGTEPVYKAGIGPTVARQLPEDLQQAVSFLTLFALQKQL